MKECDNNIQRIALNLTEQEFKGYCKGMALHWWFKKIDDPTRSSIVHRRIKFWDSAFEKHKHNCEVEFECTYEGE